MHTVDAVKEFMIPVAVAILFLTWNRFSQGLVINELCHVIMITDEYETVYKAQFIANKEFNLGTCWPDNEELHEAKDYKQVFAAGDSYLKKTSFCSGHNDKERFPVSHDFNSIIKQNQREGVTNTWGSLSSVFLLLTWYSLRILRAPWRKSYFKIKAYSGHFQHLVCSNFGTSVTQQLMAKLGYIYHQPNQTYLFHQQTWSTASWRDSLTLVGMDFFLVHVRCSIGSTKTGSLMPVCDITSGELGEKLEQKLKLKKIEIPEKLDAVQSSSPSKISGTSRHRYLDSSRVEAVPNQYVSRDAMLKHHKARSSDPGGVPWQHRLQELKLTEATLSLPDEGVELYRGDDDPSWIGTDIRYPPNDLGFNFNSEEKKLRKRESSVTKMTSSLPRTQDNYVTALPMSSYQSGSKTLLPRGGRVESGYYSEWLQAPPSHVDPRADAARQRAAGGYVYAYPIKRPPADGQPNSSLPMYHEVSEDSSPEHHVSSGSNRSVRR